MSIDIDLAGVPHLDIDVESATAVAVMEEVGLIVVAEPPSVEFGVPGLPGPPGADGQQGPMGPAGGAGGSGLRRNLARQPDPSPKYPDTSDWTPGFLWISEPYVTWDMPGVQGLTNGSLQMMNLPGSEGKTLGIVKYNSIPLPPELVGSWFSVTLWIKASNDVPCYLYWSDQTGNMTGPNPQAVLLNGVPSDSDLLKAGEWMRLSAKIKTFTSTETVTLHVGTHLTPADTVFNISGLVVEAVSEFHNVAQPAVFFDGDSMDAIWEGTPGSSQSVSGQAGPSGPSGAAALPEEYERANLLLNPAPGPKYGMAGWKVLTELYVAPSFQARVVTPDNSASSPISNWGRNGEVLLGPSGSIFFQPAVQYSNYTEVGDFNPDTTLNPIDLPADVGKRLIRGGVWIRGNAAAVARNYTWRLLFFWYDSAGVQYPAGTAPVGAVVATTGWTWLGGATVPPTNETYPQWGGPAKVALLAYTGDGIGPTERYDFANFLLEVGDDYAVDDRSAPFSSFDGDSLNARWTGTPGASPSKRLVR